MEEYRKHVCMVPRWLRDVGLTLKLSKCEFHMERMEYLGYIISPIGLQIDPKKIKTVKEWQEPVNVKGIQSFLGFANVYQWFIPDFSKITILLT
jgi:DNA topoisomerase VI subunit A